MSTLRLKFVYDDDPACALHTPNGNPLPGPAEEYAQFPILVPADPSVPLADRRELSYAEYCMYYGDPDRHVVLGAIVEKECSTCHGWIVAGSLWGIDLMDDDPALRAIDIGTVGDRHPTYYTPADISPDWGYLAEIARDLFNEAETE